MKLPNTFELGGGKRRSLMMDGGLGQERSSLSGSRQVSLLMRDRNSAAEYFDRIERRAPAYLDLLTAETDEEFETAFTAILGGAIHHLEKNKKNFQKLDEEGLSAVLAAALTIPGLIVTQEANSNGHVDLTIEADHCTPSRIKLGEAKIFSSPSYHIKGISQLLGRYTTGREAAGLLINYVRKPDIKAITANLSVRLKSSGVIGISCVSREAV
jgi:hypothetical protein